MTAQDATLSTLTRDGKQAAADWMAELTPERLSQKAQQLSQWADTVGRKLPDLSELGSPAVVTNVGPRERVVSLAAGLPLVLLSMRRGSLYNTFYAVAGAEMLYRGLTGHCPVYQAVGFQRLNGQPDPETTVPFGQGLRVAASVIVPQSPKTVYDFWHRLETLPEVMEHLVSVTVLDERRSHWVAKAPAGQTVSWNAEIIEDEPNRLISWRSLEGADVANAGSVRFDSLPDGEGTLVRVELEYVPPAGPLGAVVATLLGASPAQEIAADLAGLSDLLPTVKTRRHSAKPELSEPLGA
jgi:uncharacterized membrane protein